MNLVKITDVATTGTVRYAEALFMTKHKRQKKTIITPTQRLNDIDNRLYLVDILPGTNYSLKLPIEYRLEYENDCYYVTSREFYTVGMGENSNEALIDFGTNLLENYLTYKKIPKSKRSHDMRRVVKELQNILCPRDFHATRFTKT